MLLPGESQGRRSLVGCGLWGRTQSVVAWRIPGTEEPGGLWSMGSHRVGHDWSDLAAAAAKQKYVYFLSESESVSGSVKSDSLWTQGCSPPGSSVHKILEVRILEWVAIFSSRDSSWPRNWTWTSCIAGRFFTLWATRFLKTSLFCKDTQLWWRLHSAYKLKSSRDL